MLRQRTTKPQSSLFVCVLCRIANSGLGQRPLLASSRPRWYSSPGQKDVSRDEDEDFLLPHELAARASHTKPSIPEQPISPAKNHGLNISGGGQASQSRELPSRLNYKSTAQEDNVNSLRPRRQVANRARPSRVSESKGGHAQSSGLAKASLFSHGGTGPAAAGTDAQSSQADAVRPGMTAATQRDSPFLSPQEFSARMGFSSRPPRSRQSGLGGPGFEASRSSGKTRSPSSPAGSQENAEARPPWAQLSKRLFAGSADSGSRNNGLSRDGNSSFSRNSWAPPVDISRSGNPSKPQGGSDGNTGFWSDFSPSSRPEKARSRPNNGNAASRKPKFAGPNTAQSDRPRQQQTMQEKDGGSDFFSRLSNAGQQGTSKAKTEPAGMATGWDWVEDVTKEMKVKATVADVQRQEAEAANKTAGQEFDILVAPESNPWESEAMAESRNRRRDRGARERAEKPKAKQRVARSSVRDEDDYDDDGYSERAEQMAEARRQRKEQRRLQREQEALAKQQQAEAAKNILIPEFITVSDLGQSLGHKPAAFLKQLLGMGFEDITTESVMAGETAALVAQEYGFEPILDVGDQVDLKPRPPPEDPLALPPRPPIVTIMGHVDHGKTTMLDWLRKSSVAASEHGGITQHIGAFSVQMSNGKTITFLDTPGHAAFLTMRQRGANITDIVVLVVAADDSVKPQTIEALKHARAAKVPIIVAINKVDKEQARVEQVKADLANHGVELEDFGGDVQAVCVSGRTGQGMAELEENIVTLAEVLDMRAETDGMAEGWVLESSVKPLGRAASVLVKRGTLRKGDLVVAGTAFARVRFMLNEAGQEVDAAPPGTPVEVFGWRGTPGAGDMVLQAPDEDRARDAIRYREDMAAWQKTADGVAAQEKADRERADRERLDAELASLGEGDGGGDQDAAATTTTAAVVNFLIKGDVMGSVEAVYGAVMEIGNHEVRPRVLRSGPGQVTESDVEHAATTGSYIVNFNNPVQPAIQRLAAQKGVRILDHSVIYHLVDEVKAVMSEKLPPVVSQKVNGEAEVMQVFPINVKGRRYKNIAGCRVRNGVITRTSMYRVLRGTEEVFNGKLDSLKNVKKDISEAKKNAECGIQFEGWDDVQVGDKIQAYEEVQERRSLS